MELTPQARFLKSPDAKYWADVSVNPAFHHALETALSVMHTTPPHSPDASSNWHRMEGAREFVRVLLNLAEPPQRVRRGAPRENLEPT